MMFVDNDDDGGDDNGGATLENNNKRQVASFENDLYVCVFVSSRYYNESSKAQAKRGHHSYDARLRSIRVAMATKQTTLLSFYVFSFSLRACITHTHTQIHIRRFAVSKLRRDSLAQMCKGDKITVVVYMRSSFYRPLSCPHRIRLLSEQ